MKTILISTFALLCIGQRALAQDSLKKSSLFIPISKLKSLRFNDTNSFDFVKLSNLKSRGEKHALTKNLENAILASASCTDTPPNGIAGLTGGYKIFDYHMTAEQAYKLKIIAGGDASTDIGKEIYVYDHIFYKKGKDCNGNEITWGAGVRLVVKVKKTSANINITGLSAIAASAEMKFAEVSVDFQTIGLSGTGVNTVVPSAGGYNIEKHVEYMNKIDEIRSRINYTNTVVTPEIVSITLPNDKVDNINAIVTSYAISMIANGKSYQQALSKLSNDAPEITKEKLKQVYLQLIQRADASAITAVEKETAKQIIAQVGTP